MCLFWFTAVIALVSYGKQYLWLSKRGSLKLLQLGRSVRTCRHMITQVYMEQFVVMTGVKKLKIWLLHSQRHKRLKKVFVVLHEELKQLKQKMKDYASSHGKD
ncbi:hypothetical protein CARUB_v10010721mg [Capsella rubella]|uniref:Uncharacterized protein n=1 Tax=Capsella rubella TaxID=81985 RepID=R0IFV9_9BRAS|nr:hypothetical protein CARUB_v10010721mg [Capsella rubella]